MGVCEEAPKITGMHWQQHERYVGGGVPAYDPSRDLSPNLPVHSCDSMGDGGDSTATNTTTNSSSCNSTTSSCVDNNNSCMTPSCCRLQVTHDYNKPTPVSSPPSCKLEGGTEGTSVTCAGCGVRIVDRYYLSAVDRKWHASCLQCCQCRQTLDGEATCFSKEGNIYCKKDYYRMFGMKRCARCQAAILSSELVMRARDLVFHVHCFTCTMCNSALTKGDHFGMHGHNVFCQHHYELAARSSPSCPAPMPGYPTFPPFSSPDYQHSSPIGPPPSSVLPPQPPPNTSPCGLEHASKVQSYFNGAPTGRQKGRPRKRKPKDLESLTANLDLNSDSYLDVPYGRAGPSPGSNSQSRTKRMRTSFKHHQLRTMKSYFAINHNPDAKDLKQLSQKTGLPKRVLQVWFQNARAKWRRMMIKQEGKIPPESNVGSPLGSELMHHGQGPTDYHGGMHLQGPDTSCSPHYMMSSPPSLDCS